MLLYEGMAIRDIFAVIQDKNPGLSTYIIFAKTIRGREYSESYIAKWFNALVDKEDYDKADKDEILEYLYKYTFSTR